MDRGFGGNISKSPEKPEHASDEESFDYDEQDKQEQIEEEKANSIVRITLQPHDIYKIPLMWMMLESEVDVAIVKKRIVPDTKPREYADVEDEDEKED